MRKAVFRSSCAVAALVISVTTVHGQTILQDASHGSSQIKYYYPIGQSFRALATQLNSIGFGFRDSRKYYPNDLTTVHLYEGIGTGGRLLASVQQTLTPGLAYEMVDFDFSGEGVTLVVDDQYTAIAERPNRRWSIERSRYNPYPDGTEIRRGNPKAKYDLRFRVDFGTPVDPIATAAATLNGASRAFVFSTRGVVSGQIDAGLTARKASQTNAREAGKAAATTISTQNTPGVTGNIYTWAQITGFHADDDTNSRSYSGRGLQIGADVEIAPDMVAGLSLGGQKLSSRVVATTQDGTMRFVQPYLGYRFGAWSGEATLIYGDGDFDQVSGGSLGSGETELVALTFEGGYDIPFAGVIFTPTAAFAVGRETVTGTGGTLAGTGRTVVDFEQLSFGARYARDFVGGRYFAGLHADYQSTDGNTVQVSNLLVDDGWTGRVELGGGFDIGSDARVDTSIELGGIGGDLQQTFGALQIKVRF